MKTIFKLLTLFVILVQIVAFDKVSLYKNRSQIEKQVDELLGKNPTWQKSRCEKDNQSYSLLTIPAKRNNSLSAVIVCNVHARQLIATEACIQFVRSLGNQKYTATKILRNHVSFRVFYLANEMRDKVLEGEYCIRTNFHNVDINRNFPTGHGQENQGDETNPGPYALSQPFSKCVDEEVSNHKPDIFLDVHTGEFSLYRSTTHPKDKAILQEIISSICPNCQIRNQDKNGVMFTDMRQRHKIQWANLFEIYGGYNSKLNQTQNCFTIFNPKTKLSFEFYVVRARIMLQKYFVSIVRETHQNQQK